MLAGWGRRVPSERIVGRVQSPAEAATLTRQTWESTGAPPELYVGRPDHAFRIGLITALTRARVDREAVEYYVGHKTPGMRAPYVDPAALPLDEVAAAIPCVRRVSAPEVATLDERRQKRPA